MWDCFPPPLDTDAAWNPPGEEQRAGALAQKHRSENPWQKQHGCQHEGKEAGVGEADTLLPLAKEGQIL